MTSDPNWWRQAVVYQIYPRSFADANGDGIGDLKGITSRVPYLASLGIDAVWLSPFYPSALADGGYDVDDYRDVDPRLGTLDDFDEMIGTLHAAGLKLIVDIVPNHTSNRHEWFREALAGPAGSAARNRYVFRDGKGPDGSQPPADWPSYFGGSAWEQVPDGQWYLHLFAKEQPDLNWDNREVRDDFLTTLRFWADRGVDGFRVDVAHHLVKDFSEPLPDRATLDLGTLPHGSHPFEDRDEVHEIYAEWRQVFNEYDPPRTAVAEAWVHASRRARYASPQGLGQAFNFDLLQSDFDAATFRRIITHNLTEARESGASSTWVFSNHDVVRHATRYGLPSGSRRQAPERARLVAQQRHVPGSGRRTRSPQGQGRHPADAGVARIRATCTRARNSACTRSATCPPTSCRTPPSSARRAWRRAATAAGCRCPGPSTGPRSGSVHGGAHLPQPAWFGPQSVAGTGQRPVLDAAAVPARAGPAARSCRPPRELEWVDSPVIRCCIFVDRAAGSASPTSAPSRLRCRRGWCCPVAR